MCSSILCSPERSLICVAPCVVVVSHLLNEHEALRKETDDGGKCGQIKKQ